jgi:hypothetical protein
MYTRKSVVFFCAAVSALSLLIVLHGSNLSKARPSNVSMTTAGKTAVAFKSDKGSLGNFSPKHTIVPAVPDSADLLKEIQSALNSDEPGVQAMIFTNQLIALIEADPWAAARFAESAEAGAWRTELMRVVAQKWAESDPQEAMKWVASLADPDERDTMLSCMCFQVADRSPGQAIQLLEQQGPNDDRRDIVLGNLAQRWTEQDLPAATAWADNYPPGEVRDALFLHIALAQSQTDPVQAARMVAGQISPGQIQEQAAISVLQKWAELDLAGATAWAEEFPAGDCSNRARDLLARLAAANQSTTQASTRPQQLVQGGQSAE